MASLRNEEGVEVNADGVPMERVRREERQLKQAKRRSREYFVRKRKSQRSREWEEVRTQLEDKLAPVVIALVLVFGGALGFYFASAVGASGVIIFLLLLILMQRRD